MNGLASLQLSLGIRPCLENQRPSLRVTLGFLTRVTCSDLPVLRPHQRFEQGPQQSFVALPHGYRISLCSVCLLGLLEGFKVEKADLQEALNKKEESEQQLIVELEGLRRQLQQAARELLTLKEENSVLWNQKETFTNEAKEREAGEKCDWQEAEWDWGTWPPVPACMRTWSS